MYKKKAKIPIFLLSLLCFSLTFVSADLISIGSTGDELLLGYGNQIDLFFSGIDTDNPIITRISPTEAVSTTGRQIIYSYNVSDEHSIINCSLLMDGIIVQTSNSINKSLNQSFDFTQVEGTFIWSIQCTDYYNNIGSSGNLSIQFYTETGGGGGTGYSFYSQCYNITDSECRYHAFYDEQCPEDYFLTLEACRESLIISEINQSTLDKLMQWAEIFFDGNQTEEVKEETIQEIKEAIIKIPSDINRYFSIFASKILPSNELLGKWIIIICLLCLIFIRSLIKLIKKVKLKEEW